MNNLPNTLDGIRQRLKATGLLDLPPTSIAGLHFISGLEAMVGQIVADPGKYLLRFPFSFLPARWILSETAMKAITVALYSGVKINDEGTGREGSRNKEDARQSV